MTDAHTVVVCAACPCFSRHRSRTFLEQSQLEQLRQRLLCSCLLTLRQQQQSALLLLASSTPRCFLPRVLALPVVLQLDDTRLNVLSAFVDPLSVDLSSSDLSRVCAGVAAAPLVQA